jgi:hypothetical protein
LETHRLNPAVSADSCIQVRPKPSAQRIPCGRRRRSRRQRSLSRSRDICHNSFHSLQAVA